MISKPLPGEASDYVFGYINIITENDLIEALNNTLQDSITLFSAIQDEAANKAYAEGKWTIKEVLAHVIDAERVFAYRALRFSRQDATPLEGFDENTYTPNSNANARKLNDIVEEYKNLRQANIYFCESLTDEMLDFKGIANGNPVTAKALGWMIAGHNARHNKVIRERYL